MIEGVTPRIGARRADDVRVTVDIRNEVLEVHSEGSARVPFIDLARTHEPIADAILAEWAALLRTGAFIGGGAVVEFEDRLANFVGVQHAVGVANGTDAITLALRGLGIQPGDEVITAANTFFATVEGIVHAGGVPVLADVDPMTATIDPGAVERAITPRTRFVVPVHLYGQPADMDALLDLGRTYRLDIVEDNAQALGAFEHGRRTGSIGHAAATSFYPGKNLGACGDGGAVTTDDPDVAMRIRQLGQHGQVRKYEHEVVGYNSRLDAVQAAALSVKLGLLDGWNADRRLTADAYRAFLAGTGVDLPTEVAERVHVYHLFVLRHPERDHIRRVLETRGIGCGLHYPVPIHLTRPFVHLGDGPGSFPNAEAWANTGLSIPMFPGMNSDEILATVAAVMEGVREVDALSSSLL